MDPILLILWHYVGGYEPIFDINLDSDLIPDYGDGLAYGASTWQKHSWAKPSQLTLAPNKTATLKFSSGLQIQANTMWVQHCLHNNSLYLNHAFI